MHDCIFQFIPEGLMPDGMVAVRCRCHEDDYATRFPIDEPYQCPVSGQVAPQEAP